MAGPSQTPTNVGTSPVDRNINVEPAPNTDLNQSLQGTTGSDLSNLRQEYLSNSPQRVAQLQFPEINISLPSPGQVLDSIQDTGRNLVNWARDAYKSMGPGLIVNLTGTQFNILGEHQTIGPLPPGQRSGSGYDADGIRLTSNLGSRIRVNGNEISLAGRNDGSWTLKIPNHSTAIATVGADGVIDISVDKSLLGSPDCTIVRTSSIVGRSPSWNPQMPTQGLNPEVAAALHRVYGEMGVTNSHRPDLASF